MIKRRQGLRLSGEGVRLSVGSPVRREQGRQASTVTCGGRQLLLPRIQHVLPQEHIAGHNNPFAADPGAKPIVDQAHHMTPDGF